MIFALPCQLAAADRLAAAAGLILALRWPSGPWPSDPLAVWTLVPSDAYHYRRLVAIGARHCWRGMVRETTRSTGSFNTRSEKEFPAGHLEIHSVSAK
jgi:hypothetical protein